MSTEKNGEDRDENGRFTPGNPGRPKGPNKVSMKVKEAIVAFLEKNMDNVQEDFDQLKPRERVQFIADILPYAVPKLSAIQSEVDNNIKGGFTIKIGWEDPNVQTGQSESPDGNV
jgi:hypothetical protein